MGDRDNTAQQRARVEGRVPGFALRTPRIKTPSGLALATRHRIPAARIEMSVTPIPSTKLHPDASGLLDTQTTFRRLRGGCEGLGRLGGGFQGAPANPELEKAFRSCVKRGAACLTFGAASRAALYARAIKDPVWSPRVTSHESPVTAKPKRKANKRLIATTPNSRFAVFTGKQRRSQKLIATKTALPLHLSFAGLPNFELKQLAVPGKFAILRKPSENV